MPVLERILVHCFLKDDNNDRNNWHRYSVSWMDVRSGYRVNCGLKNRNYWHCTLYPVSSNGHLSDLFTVVATDSESAE